MNVQLDSWDGNAFVRGLGLGTAPDKAILQPPATDSRAPSYLIEGEDYCKCGWGMVSSDSGPGL